MHSQYTALRAIRDSFGKLIPSRFGTSKTLIPEVRRHLSKAAPLADDEMKRQYDAIYGSDARKYDYFPTIPDTSILDNVAGAEILGVVIANAAQTDFAQFLARIDATEWMRQAHEKYHGNSEGHCPYCYRSLGDDFEKTFIESFDDQYEKNLDKLNAFFSAYRDCANRLYLHISKLPEDIYPKADEKTYRGKLEVLKSAISGNMDLIKSKLEDPTRIVVLGDIAWILDDVMEMANAINGMIRTNNDAYNAKTKMITVLRENLFCHMAYELQSDFRNHDQSRKMISDGIEAQEKVIGEHQ